MTFQDNILDYYVIVRLDDTQVCRIGSREFDASAEAVKNEKMKEITYASLVSMSFLFSRHKKYHPVIFRALIKTSLCFATIFFILFFASLP